jgi:hypothetical protein
MSLTTYLRTRVFKGIEGVTVTPTINDLSAYDNFISRYKVGLDIEREAVNVLKEEN